MVKQNNSNKFSGFTLVELVIVIAIMGMILGISIYAYRNSQDRTNLKASAEIMVSELRTAQNMSQTGSVQRDNLGETYVPPYGYGIYVTSDPEEAGSNERYEFYEVVSEVSAASLPADSELLETIDLNQRIYISQILAGEEEATAALIYFPVDGSSRVALWASAGGEEITTPVDISIVLASERSEQTRTIKIFANSGIIEITE